MVHPLTFAVNTKSNAERPKVIAFPPIVILTTFVVAILLHSFWEPLTIFPKWWIGHIVGWPITIVGGMLAKWAERNMSKVGVDPKFKPVKAMVTTGPFAKTRNPMYVGTTKMYLGISLILNTLWPILFLSILLIYLHFGVVLREEQYLERVFGDEYRQYKIKVRRWI